MGSTSSPAEAVLSFDYRTIHLAELERLEKTLLILADEQAERFALEVRVEKNACARPALMDEGCQNAIVMAADVLGLSYVRMPSGAGHDAQNMAAICPSAMVFVPSVGGLSHCPQEYTPDRGLRQRRERAFAGGIGIGGGLSAAGRVQAVDHPVSVVANQEHQVREEKTG